MQRSSWKNIGGGRISDLEDLLKSGIINLDKPMGPSSHQVSAWARKILGAEKAGHGGTLDPRVTGVLVIMIGDSARGAPALLSGDKEYLGVIRFHRDIRRKLAEDVISEFEGRIYQFPPVRSAVKRRRRMRTVYEMEILEFSKRDCLVRVLCESGTYIRTLAVDIGRATGYGAHLQELRRTRSGPFRVEDSVSLQELADAMHYYREDGDETALECVLQPFERMFEKMKKVVVKSSAVDALCHGAPLMAPGVRAVDMEVGKGDQVAVWTEKEEIVGLGRTEGDARFITESAKGVVVKMERVFMEPGTYPRIWKVK